MFITIDVTHWTCSRLQRYIHRQVAMDPMKALASLDLVSARGLETPDQGPRMLADSVRF